MNELKLYSDTLKEIKKDIINTNFRKDHNDIYQNTVSYEKRCSESLRLVTKYPGHVPIIVNSLDKELKFNKKKFIVPRATEGIKFLSVLRSQICIESAQAIFVFVDNMLFSNMKTIGEIYDEYLHRNNINYEGDRFLYLTVNRENTFG